MDRLTIEEVEMIAKNAIYAASQRDDWRELGLNIEHLAKQLADTMRENERLRSFIEGNIMIMADGGYIINATFMKKAAQQALSNKDSDDNA